MYYNRQYPFQEQVPETMQLINDTLNLEILVADYYGWLLDNIPIEGLTIPQRKEISDRLLFIRDDKLKHADMLKEIYMDFTGKEVELTSRDFIAPKSFVEGIKTGLFQQADLVRRYREIMVNFTENHYRDMLSEIITDELLISDLFNYIYTTVFLITKESRSRKK